MNLLWENACVSVTSTTLPVGKTTQLTIKFAVSPQGEQMKLSLCIAVLFHFKSFLIFDAQSCPRQSLQALFRNQLTTHCTIPHRSHSRVTPAETAVTALSQLS